MSFDRIGLDPIRRIANGEHAADPLERLMAERILMLQERISKLEAAVELHDANLDTLFGIRE